MTAVSVSMRPWGELVYGTPMKARSAFGDFEVPNDVYVRSLRLDRNFPRNYPDGYLGAWCKRQWEKSLER